MATISTSSDFQLPEEIRIINLAIGISDETNASLNFNSDQYLIVGEKNITENTSNQKIYSLLVDETGVAINTSFTERKLDGNTNALYVDGDIFITGNINGKYINQLLGSNHVTSNNAWFNAATCNVNQNIYYSGNATIGNLAAATNNCNAFNIVRTANRVIDQSQFSIQNLQLSQFRTAILGGASNSPIVMNTRSGSGALEFHMSRDQAYFNKTYISSNVILGQTIYTSNNSPIYTGLTVEDAPHFRIDESGHVGIHTSMNRPLTYNMRTAVRGDPLDPTTTSVIETPALHVEGTLYSSNIVILDYLTQEPKHLDEVYLRRFGVSIPASQIYGETFGLGVYTFPSNVIVLGNQQILGNTITTGNTTTSTLTVFGQSFMSNSLYVQQDMHVSGATYINNGIYTRIIDPTTNVISYSAIQFTPAQPALSNVNYFGQGLTTPGQFGVGINPLDPSDIITNQLVSYKRDPTMWEFELIDKSYASYKKAAYIGHPSQENTFPLDGSLVICTPQTTDPNYTGIRGTVPQNIYFFPGSDPKRIPFMKQTEPPTLGVFSTHQIGINTYNPNGSAALTVNGDISYNGNIYTSSYLHGVNLKLAQFVELTSSGYTLPNTNFGYFNGIQYVNSNAPYVGINTGPNPNYGLIISGGVKSIDGYYTLDDHRIISWLDSSFSSPNGTNSPISASNLYTWGNVGIGIQDPTTANLVLKNNYGNPTSIQLMKSDTNYTSTIQFTGEASNQWTIAADYQNNLFEIGYGLNTLNTNSYRRPIMIKQRPIHLGQTPPQVYIGTDIHGLIPGITNTIDPNAILNVGGNLAVMGDVNITGTFKINSVALVNSNIIGLCNIQSISHMDDIVMTAANIHLNALSNYSVLVGSPFTNMPLNNIDQNIKLRVYSSYGSNINANQMTPVASFQSTGSNSLIDFMITGQDIVNTDSRNGKITMGLFTPNPNISQNYSFAILDGIDSPYLSFYNVPNSTSRFTGVNTLNPTAILHLSTGIADYGSNMLRLTKQLAGNSDTTSVAPQIELQKTYSSRAPTSWVIAGPDASWNQKLALRYTDANTSQTEVFCFTSNGCIGIGTTEPSFALDIASTGKQGSLRLWNSGNDGAPQLLFQSGNNNYYGDESIADYRMMSSNGEFKFDMQKNYISYPIYNISSNANIGIGTSYSTNYDVNLAGNVNIETGLFLGGTPLFTLENGGGFTYSAQNFFFNPTVNYGGIAVNSITPTSNLFYIHSGINQNLLVLDSSFEQAQIHFRTRMSTSGIYNMYRMSANTSNFEWNYSPNYGSSLYIPDTEPGYSQAFSFGVSQRHNAIHDFDTNIFGSIILNTTTPYIFFGSNTSTAPYIYSSNNAIQLYASCNIGIGTNTPNASFAIYNNNTISALSLQQDGSGDLIQLFNNGSQLITITSNTYIGIGTTLPQSSIEVATGQILMHSGSSKIPSYSFSTNSNIGIYSTSSNQFALTATSNEIQMIFDSSGKVILGGGTSNIFGSVIISGSNISNIPVPLYVINQQGNGDIMRIYNSNASNTIVIDVNGNLGIGTTLPKYPIHVQGILGVSGTILPSANNTYDIGTPTSRWRDIYLSGNTINLGGSKITQDTDGTSNIKLINGINSNKLLRIIVDDIQLGSNTHKVILQPGYSNLNIVVFDTQGNSNLFTPVLQSDSGIIGIGTSNTNAKLHVVSSNIITALFDQQGPYDIARFTSNGYSNSPLVTIKNNGYVGIGTSNPSAPLTIFASNTVVLPPNTPSLNVPVPFIIQQNGDYGNIAHLRNRFNEGVLINSLGYVGINTLSPQSNLHVVGNYLFEGTGQFTSNVYIGAHLEVFGNAIAHGNTITDSDRRIKKDLIRIDNALNKVKDLTGYTFTNINSGQRSTGLVAQDVQSVLPEAVYTEGKYLGLAYGNLMGIIVEAIKELSDQVSDIKNKLNV